MEKLEYDELMEWGIENKGHQVIYKEKKREKFKTYILVDVNGFCSKEDIDTLKCQATACLRNVVTAETKNVSLKVLRNYNT